MGKKIKEAQVDDPFRSEVVERALERYIGLLPAAAIEEMRSFLTDALAIHPVGSELLDRARPRPAREVSDDTVKRPKGLAEPAKEEDGVEREEEGGHK